MSVSILALDNKPKQLGPDDFRPGESVTVIKNQNPKEGVKRKGRIVWVGEIFVCIWLCSLVHPEKYGWRECFFYSDLLKGQVSIERRKTKKKGVCT